MAQKETIKFTIRQDGTVNETVMGVTGPNCEKLTEGIESNLWPRWEYRGANKNTKLKDILIYLYD